MGSILAALFEIVTRLRRPRCDEWRVFGSINVNHLSRRRVRPRPLSKLRSNLRSHGVAAAIKIHTSRSPPRTTAQLEQGLQTANQILLSGGSSFCTIVPTDLFIASSNGNTHDGTRLPGFARVTVSRLLVNIDGTSHLMARRTLPRVPVRLGWGRECQVTVGLTHMQCPQQAQWNFPAPGTVFHPADGAMDESALSRARALGPPGGGADARGR